MVLTVTPWSPRCAGLVSHRRLTDKSEKLDTSVGVPGPHGFAVRKPASFVNEAARVHRIPPRVRNVRETPLLPGQDAGVFRSDLPDVPSEEFFRKGLDKSISGFPK